MQISLNEKLSKFVEERVRSGQFASPEEVVHAALAYFRQQEVVNSFPRELLTRLIDEGERSIAEHGLLDADEAFNARRERRASGIQP